MNNRLIKQLAKSRKNVKYKYKTLKTDILKSQSQLAKAYNPITKLSKQLIATIEQTEPRNIKVEAPEKGIQKLESIVPKSGYDNKTLTPKYYQKEDDTVMGTQNFIDELLREYTVVMSEENPAFHEYLEQYSELPRIYI